jgi:hypothetical protein
VFFFVNKILFAFILGFTNTSYYPDNDESSLLNGSKRTVPLSNHPFHAIRLKHNEGVILISLHDYKNLFI